MENNEYRIDFNQSFDNHSVLTDSEKIKITCNEAILTANEKANNLEPWKNGASPYLIDQFLVSFDKSHRKSVLNFKVEQKSYECYHLTQEENLKTVTDRYLKDKNKKNAYKYSSVLAKNLFNIILDYLDYISNDSNIRISKHTNFNSSKSLDEIDFDKLSIVPTVFTSRFKNFERDLLINEYNSKKEDIDNKGMRTLIYGSSQLYYISSNENFFIISYSPANEQYYNQKIKEVNKAPSFSFFIYSKEIEDYFINNFELLNNLHKNFIQFTYLADTNQNIVNAMGEASLIAQYWYTESVNRILKDHDKELKKSKDSRLLAEYIIRYILAAEIDGVELIEVYPFDRVFMFNNSIFESNKDKYELSVFEGLLESKVPHEGINDKEFLGGQTQYAFEWERETTEFSLDRFDPSKKKIKEISANLNSFNIKESEVWEKDYNKDDETVINNLLLAMLQGDKKYIDRTEMLEYKSKHSIGGITYLYSSGTNLETQIPSLYNLQEYYLKNLPNEQDNGINKGVADILFDDNHEHYFDNVKVVLFSYTPENEKSEKGFTLLLIANDDVPKALMEQKSEKDDLNTALKLLINQHFTIDQRYKEQSLKEQSELIDILTQTKHSVKNSFENFPKNGNLNELKEKVLAIIDQDRTQMIEQGRDATIKKYEHHDKSTLENSLKFLQSLFITTEISNDKVKTSLSKKFSETSDQPWDYFARKIYNLELNDLKEGRIHTITWKGTGRPIPKLDLKIDFNELQNFSMEWKESLFNDAIYVMLKNACEHSIETFEGKDNHREIFLDMYISEDSDGEALNIEFTNHTGKMCKKTFEHINSATTIKNNAKKKNSTGIGVVTIRKRLDVTYGQDKANLKFTVISEDKIKSLLYFPIRSLHNDLVFLDSNECSQRSNILYLEDSSEYYSVNIDTLEKKSLNCTHEVRFKRELQYGNYNMLITDLNIYGPDDDKPSASNGIDAIKYFTAKNPNGVVIVLSTDIDDIKEKNFNNYVTIAVENDFSGTYERKHVYLYKQKQIDDKILALIVGYQEGNSDVISLVVDSNENRGSRKAIGEYKKKVKKFDSIIPFASIANTTVPLAIEEVNGKLFVSDNLPDDIQIWLNKEIELDEILSYDITNCEKPDVFVTKLIKFDENPNFILKHEFIRRNIIVIPEILKENELKIFEYVYDTVEHDIPKNGIFGKISHDILNKMPEFSIYTIRKIEELKALNNSVRSSFNNYFENYLNGVALTKTFKEIEYDFNLLIKELEQLKNEAQSKNTHLGTDIDVTKSIINKLKFIRS
jgi:hypothetical protein